MKNFEFRATDICKQHFQPVVDAVSQLLAGEDAVLLVAIDGKCASGKTTLGYYLQQKFDCNLFHMDDFFLQNSQRTPERMAEVGGNVDYERFSEEVILPLKAGKSVLYRLFRCDIREIQEGYEVQAHRLNIIEGSYSQHPYFGEVHQLKVFTEISEELQKKRIAARNGEAMLSRFISEWIPKENAYFESFGIMEKSDIVVENNIQEFAGECVNYGQRV